MFFNKIKKPCNLGKRTPEQRKNKKKKSLNFMQKERKSKSFNSWLGVAL